MSGDLANIEREIASGLAHMRVEAGIEKPHRIPHVALALLIFAFAAVLAGILQ